MSYTTPRFNEAVTQLTSPENGLVIESGLADMYLVNANPIQIEDNTSPLLVITGPSRAGKDTIAEQLLQYYSIFERVGTASTRMRRDSEHPDAMTWMRKKTDSETPDKYLASLIEEYGLIEYSQHNGEIYGLPAANLDKVAYPKVPLINTDTSGIRTLKERLKGKFSLISFMVCPESGEQLERRMNTLGTNVALRLDMAQQYLESAPECVNAVIHNRDHNDATAAGVNHANNIAKLLHSFGVIRTDGYTA